MTKEDFRRMSDYRLVMEVEALVTRADSYALEELVDRFLELKHRLKSLEK